MSKPPGLRVGLMGRNGPPFMSVHHPSRTEDRIWDAIQEAQSAGWTVEQFRRECADAWDTGLRDARDDDRKAWDK